MSSTVIRPEIPDLPPSAPLWRRLSGNPHGRTTMGDRMESVLRGSVALLLACSVGAAWWLADKVAANVEETAVEAAFVRAEGDATAAELFTAQAIEGSRVLRELAQRWLLLDADATEARREVERSMRNMVASSTLPVAHTAVADQEGRIVWDSAGGSPDIDLGGTGFFRRHREGHVGPWVGSPGRASSAAEPLIPITWRLHDAAGDFAGIALVDFRPPQLSQALGAILRRPDGFVSVVRADGELLARSRDLPGLVGRRVIPEETLRALQRSGTLRLRVRSAMTGEDMLLALRQLRDANIVLAAGVPADTVLLPARQFRTACSMAALAYGLAVLLGGMIGFGLLRTRRLRREAAALRAGRAEVERLHTKLPAVVFLRDVAPDGSSRPIYRAGDIAGVTGWPQDELNGNGSNWGNLFSDDTADKRASNLAVLRDGSADLRWRLRQPDGSWRYLATRMELLSTRPDGGGEVVGYVRDVTAEHKAAEREKAARRELDRTLARAPVVVFRARVWTKMGDERRRGRGCYREDYVSRSLKGVTGWTEDSLSNEGGLFGVLGPWALLAEGIEAMKLADGWSADLTLRRPDDGRMMVRMTTNVITRSDTFLDIVGYLVDVSAEREAKARAIGSARLASLGEIAAGMAHELKQPLQAIALAVDNTQTASRRGDHAAVEKRLARIAEYTRRAGATVEHLRRFARGADEAAPLEPMRLEEAVEGAMAVIGVGFRDTGVEMVQKLGAPAPVAFGHMVALQQVLVNLFSNARDVLATLPANEPRRVVVCAGLAEGGEWIDMTVSDTGGGIPPQVMAHLFEPFVTTKGMERGTGLGLSICQGLIKHMGGSISARNDAQGAVFTIRLRAAPAHLQGTTAAANDSTASNEVFVPAIAAQ
jgi:signal transduction histidine kinase